MPDDRKGVNPKDLLGSKKVSLTKLPAVAALHGAHAMMDGARKYGPYNWRDNAVISHIYVDAAKRHLESWFDEQEECAPDSGVHHLGHVIACCAILLDAQETGNLVDDRPKGGCFARVLARLNESIAAKQTPVPQPSSQSGFCEHPQERVVPCSYCKGEIVSVHRPPSPDKHI